MKEILKRNGKLDFTLVGQNGNAFNLLGIFKRAAKKADWPQEDIIAVLNEGTSGDYNNLLRTLMFFQN